MALNADIDGIVTVVPTEEEAPAAPIPWMEAPARVRRPRRWMLPVAIGVAGLDPLDDQRGRTDRYGRKLAGTIIAVADQLAAAAGLLMPKAAGCPAVLIRL